MSTYAALTDGTTTVTFASPGYAGYYKIESGWGPRVAGLRQSQFGGRGPYEDVTEEIPVSVGGSNAAHLYANVSALKGLLDNANRWWRNEGASATLFKYSPEGATISSTGSPLQVATWGAALELPPGFPSFAPSGGAVWNTGLTMRFTRKGEWLHNTQSASISGANMVAASLTFASAASYWSPIDFSITNHYTASSLTGFVLVSSLATGIQQTTFGGPVSSDGRWTAVAAGSIYNSFGASIARFDPTATSAGSGIFTTPGLSLTQGKRYSVFAVAKNNSATVTYSFSVGVRLGASAIALTNPVNIPTGGSAANPVPYSLGVIVPSYTTTPMLWVVATPSATAGSGNYLDVDSVFLMDEDYGAAIKLWNPVELGSAGSTNGAHNYLTKTAFTAQASPSTYYLSYSGQMQSLSGASAQVALVATEGSYFRQATGSAASLARSNTWTLTRTNAYITPV